MSKKDYQVGWPSSNNVLGTPGHQPQRQYAETLYGEDYKNVEVTLAGADEVKRNARILVHEIGEKLVDSNIEVAEQVCRELGIDITSLKSRAKGLKLLRKKLAETVRKRNMADEKLKSALEEYAKTLSPLERAAINQAIESPRQMADDAELVQRCMQNFKLEKPQGTSLHHLIDYVRENCGDIAPMLTSDFKSFVVEHDWAKAFEGVDMDGGEVKLPYDYTAFEFRVSGLRMIMLLGLASDEVEGLICTGIEGRWYVNPSKIVWTKGQLKVSKEIGWSWLFNRLLEQLSAQIRAVCIMLDAGVAVGEVRSQGGQGLNKKRAEKGLTPLKDYHVVSLARRYRGSTGEGGTGVRHRLHWRRGHWRHFMTLGGAEQYIDCEGYTRSRTWINWQLVGDEKLGFVDKHYRL